MNSLRYPPDYYSGVAGRLVASVRVFARRFLQRLIRTLLGSLIVAVSCVSAFSQDLVEQTVVLTERECKLKYAYLYSFSLLTTWPKDAFDSTDNPFVIGVLGTKPHSELLDKLAATRKTGERRILIRRFKSPDDYNVCHILYVTDAVSRDDRKAILALTRRDPVLVVGETEGFEESGGVMNFYFSGTNVRFFLNLDEADRRGLSASARLSKVATVVRADSTAGK